MVWIVLILVLIACGGTLGQVSPTPTTNPASGCTYFPADHILNTPVDTLPLDSRSAAYINSIGPTRNLHPDFGTFYEGSPIGIPFTTVPGNQPKVAINFTAYGNESDPGPYPIPRDAPVEGGPSSDGDRHVLVVDRDNCKLYELFRAFPKPNGAWDADSGAVFDLRSYALRPAGWTSSDAAGLPVMPLLVHYDEVQAGEIKHAIRFAVQRSRRAYVWPARHFASSLTDPNLPPMGQRFRLKADFDISGFHPQVQVILRAMKKYGIILSDHTSSGFIPIIGAHDPRWEDETLSQLKRVRFSSFEAVDVSGLMLDGNSGRARQP